MKDLKRIIFALTFVSAIAMTSCTKPDTAAEDELYEQESVDLTKGHRPGTKGGN